MLSYSDTSDAKGGPLWIDNVKVSIPPDDSLEYIDDNFDEFISGFLNGQNNWSATTINAVIGDDNYYGASGKAIYIPENADINKSYSAQQDKYDISFNLRAALGSVSGENRFNIYLQSDDATHAVALAMDYNTGNWQYNDGGVWHTSGVSVETNNWLTLKISVNTTDDKYSVWINNETNSVNLITDASFRHSGTIPDEFRVVVYTDSAVSHSGPVWFDNIEVPIIYPKGTLITIH